MAADYELLRSSAEHLFKRGGGLHPTPEVIKSWPRPNYINPEQRGWEAPIVLLIFLGITVAVYIARMWARLAISKNGGIDDILISLSMIPLFGLTIAVVLGIVKYGFHLHAWDQTAKTMVTTREITMAIELNYMLSTTLIKVSILFFYRRITGSLTNHFVYWVWGTIIFCVGYGILFTFLIVFTCTPVIGFFHVFDMPWRLQNELHCRDEGAIIVACAAISSVQDLLICMLPIFLVWNLQISRRQKVALCGIFGMGLITCVCGIMRTYYATYVYYYTYDITWYAYYGWVWTVLEAQLGVVCASAPAIKVFFKRYFNIVSSRNGYSGTGSRKTPLGSSRKSRGYQMASGPHASHVSASRSHIVGGGAHDSEVPLGGIKISQGLDVSIEERDDMSQKSFASTRKLTTLPASEQSKAKGGWGTVCASLKPTSRSDSRSRSREKDLEYGPE